MANEVTSSNSMTMLKALQTLMKDGAMTMDEAMAALDRLTEAGLLIREPAEKPRRETRDAKETVTVADPSV